jgi:dihydroorotate dehydrogenase (NAD+) catalytic subunit
MTTIDTRLGPLRLATPLVAAAGTFGSVVDFTAVSRLDAYGAVVAKSVSAEPWQGRPAPRVSGVGGGMLNGIGIQNPGIDAWMATVAPRLKSIPVPVWGSAVGRTPEEFAFVASRMAGAGVSAVEVNLSCPNLEGGQIIALDSDASARAVAAVRAAVEIPIGAKLSPNASDIVSVASSVENAGADFVTLTNTIRGAAIDIETRRPVLSGLVGGYSGPPIKPIAIACVIDVFQAMADLPIVGCGGVRSGRDVVEYLLAGASAVCLGTIHFTEPRAGDRIRKELLGLLEQLDVDGSGELVGGLRPW